MNGTVDNLCRTVAPSDK